MTDMKTRKPFLLLILSMAFALVGQAQEVKEKNYYEYPHLFFGLQGGIQNTFKNNVTNWSNVTPTASFSFGGWATRTFGARLHLNGVWDKGSKKIVANGGDRHYEYKYLTTDIDALINLCNAIGKKDHYPVNLILVLGLGGNYAWDNKQLLAMSTSEPQVEMYTAAAQNKNRWAINTRAGLMLDIPLCRYLSFNLEADMNYLIPGSATRHFVTDNLQFLGQAGLNIRFGHKSRAVEKTPVYTTRTDTIWYDDIVYNPRVENSTIAWNVFYEIRESEFNDAEAQLASIGAFLKDHRECQISIQSYADVETGNPRINMEYSRERAEKAKEALINAGVDGSIITSEYYGDTVQPFPQNDRNRVSIITATGLKDMKDKLTVKKFRTKEVQVEVK